MASTRIDYTTMEWSSGRPFYGPAAVYDGKDIVQLKVLSDRRKEGGGIAWLVKMTPPPGKLIKIVAVALVRRAIFSLQGRPQHQERRAGAGMRAAWPQSQGPAAQRHDRPGDDGAGDLCRRARRDPVDGGVRYRRGAPISRPRQTPSRNTGGRRGGPPPAPESRRLAATSGRARAATHPMTRKVPKRRGHEQRPGARIRPLRSPRPVP